MANCIEPGDNPDLTEERRKATFSVRSMSEFIFNGEDKLAKRMEIAAYVDATQDLHDPRPVEFMSRVERHDNSTRKAVNMAEHGPAINVLDYETGHHFSNLIMARDSHPFELHYGMFLPTLRGQGTDEQQEKWIPLALIRAIVGTYAQTELGHGTNLRKLEVTSTYDPKTQEFVLHSPTVTATKWWPGGLGKTSNYAIVVAQLWTLGKCYGPHPFLVQLRDLETHQPLPGIKLGDIGPKLGFNANDNGFLIFDHLRIPRDQMLMRHAQVLPNGEYVKPAHSKLGYGTMVYVRSMMIGDQGLQLGIAATIAIRYSAIRRQGEMVEGQGEVKVLDYQTQQYRIFPQMAKAYAYIFASTKVRDMYTKNMKLMKSGNVSLLPELHALSSGLKAVVTWEVAQGIEQCRLACGGHGFSQASGFPELYAQTVAGCTYEGENIVLLLQVSKFLVKAARQVRSGEAALLAEVAEYLGVVGANRSTFSQSHNFSDKIVIEAFEHVARRLVFSALDKLDHLRGEGVGPEEAWNRTSVELCKASRAHVRLYLVKTFLSTVETVKEATLKRALRDLAGLFVFNTIYDCSFSFIEDGFMSAQQIEYVKSALYASLEKLRPNAVALVDSFNVCDRELHSVLGRRDGIVYPNLLEWAKQSDINKLEVLPAFHKYLGPMMKNARSKL